MRRVLLSLLLIGCAARPLSASGDELQDHLRQYGKPPADYLLSKLDDHRVVIVGEGHWQRADAELIGSMVGELRRRNVTLAMEFFPAGSQGDLDRLLSAPQWDPALANRIMRAGSWPYVQYRDILRQAWQANRSPGPPPLKILAISPPEDFRKQGIRYDTFLADRVGEYARDEGHRLLVYCGMHHAFTRYQMVERLIKGRATEFTDRMGNVLWRQFGQEVFLVALHKAEGCSGDWEHPYDTYCAPLGGVIDCGAVRNGAKPVGFDVVGSPVAEVQFDAKSFYRTAHPLLRLTDYTDGYIWQAPIEETKLVDLIPLEEYAPEDAASAENRADWAKRAEDLANPKKRPSWSRLSDWRVQCPEPVKSPPASRSQ
jgi:hypothetical protein